MRTCSLSILRQVLRLVLSAFRVLAAATSTALKSRATLQLENLALRHQLGVLRRSVKRVRSRNSSNTVIPRGVWTEFPLPSVGSPSTGIHNLRPEQALHKHTEHPRDHDQLPSA